MINHIHILKRHSTTFLPQKQ